jgi:hypothetical protein
MDPSVIFEPPIEHIPRASLESSACSNSTSAASTLISPHYAHAAYAININFSIDINVNMYININIDINVVLVSKSFPYNI